MADNIYLLETRLSKAQRAALAAVREVAKAKGLTVFLVGGAVRDLIGGTAVRDLDVVVQGNALKIKKDIEKAGGSIAGEMEARQAFFVRFPGGVRMEIGSTLTVHYPKPGKAVAKPANILDDLRRRDFTANAMALSLNEGSYGLLMDPTNGVADIENRELRLVSNYGFIEDPVRMIRAARLMARLGWGMEEKTQTRYETGKAEGYISAMDEFHRGYETEEIFHEEDALRVMRRLEEEGWMQSLAPTLSTLKVNVPELERLRESQAQLQIQGVVADAAAANFPYLTAKLTPTEVEALKKSFPRPGFVEEIEGLEAKGKEFAAKLGAKGAALPSQAYRLLTSADPEAVLWTAHTTKSGALQTKFRSFYTEWPQARQRIPYVLMQEMRILPELPDYDGLVDKLFLELMDGKLGTVEEIKAYLEPYSPPAPPPPVSLRRPRAAKKDAKPTKSRKKAAEPADTAGESGDGEGQLEEAAAGDSRADSSAAAGATGAVPDSGITAATKASGNGTRPSKAAGASPGAKGVSAGGSSGAATAAAEPSEVKGSGGSGSGGSGSGGSGSGGSGSGGTVAPGSKALKSGAHPAAATKAVAQPAAKAAAKTGSAPAATTSAAKGAGQKAPEQGHGVEKAAAKAVPAKKVVAGKGTPAAKKAVPVKAKQNKAPVKQAKKVAGPVAKKAAVKGMAGASAKGKAGSSVKGKSSGASAKGKTGASAKAPAKKAAAKGGAKKTAGHASSAKKATSKGRH